MSLSQSRTNSSLGDMLKPLQNTTMRIAIELFLMVEIRQTRADTCIYDYIYIHFGMLPH